MTTDRRLDLIGPGACNPTTSSEWDLDRAVCEIDRLRKRVAELDRLNASAEVGIIRLKRDVTELKEELTLLRKELQCARAVVEAARTRAVFGDNPQVFWDALQAYDAHVAKGGGG